MPDFVGQSLAAARSALQQVNIKIGTPVSAGTPSAPNVPAPGTAIVAQNPPAGAKVTAGSTVTFDVR
jgi:beta-lactam-binding protein with PASTA domain